MYNIAGTKNAKPLPLFHSSQRQLTNVFPRITRTMWHSICSFVQFWDFRAAVYYLVVTYNMRLLYIKDYAEGKSQRLSALWSCKRHRRE